MARRRYQSHSIDGSEEASPNLTPLIDVVFVVLIMFIIIAPMLEIDKVRLADAAPRQEKQITNVQEASPITIHVREDNSIWLNSVRVKPEELLHLLKAAKKQNPSRVPQLFHDRKAHFGTYQTIKNAVELSGFEELDVILQPG
jgi:biopolymer transport protein ExbD